jgi:hypothetical protein
MDALKEKRPQRFFILTSYPTRLIGTDSKHPFTENSAKKFLPLVERECGNRAVIIEVESLNEMMAENDNRIE